MTASAGAALLVCLAAAETRPRYGGTLRVEVREMFESAESAPPIPGFAVSNFDPGKRVVYIADDNTVRGRPYIDGIEVQMGRTLRDQAADLESGKADLVQLAPADARRQVPGRKVWSSSPVRLVTLVFGLRVEDARVREALALALDRGAIHAVLLQRLGEISGSLLPQWLSGYEFLFPVAPDLAKARSLVGTLPPGARTLTLAVADPSDRTIADRIVVNARDAGLMVTVTAQSSTADLRLVEARIASTDPVKALGSIAQQLGLTAPPQTDSPEQLYEAEHGLLEGFRVVPLFHLPEVLGAGPRVRGGSGLTSLAEWRFDNLWLEDRQ